MAKFLWGNGNLGFYGCGQLGADTMSGLDASGVTLTYDAGQGALDPQVLAASISLVFRGYSSYIVETGPDAGKERVTGGILAELHCLNAAGAEMLGVTGLTVELPGFLATLGRGDAFSAWGMVTYGVNRVTGSADASGPGHAGTGDVLDTGALADVVTAPAGNESFVFTAGNDSAHGGLGADLFTYKGTAFDDDTVDDFSTADGDKIVFAPATSFAQLRLANIKVGAVDAVNVQFGSGSVTIMELTVAQLHPSDFGF